MNKRKLLCTSSFIAAALCISIICVVYSGCVQSVATPDLPYVEQLAISGFLFADSSTVAINVTRSLPLDVEYTFEKAAVADAIVTLGTPKGDLVLAYDSLNYQYRVPFRVQIGIRYTLHVLWHGRNASASTVVPKKPEVISLIASKDSSAESRQKQRIKFSSDFLPDTGAAFCVSISAYLSSLADTSFASQLILTYRGLPNFRSVISGIPTDSGVVMSVRGGASYEPTDNARFVALRFNAVDKPYYEFWKTFRNSRNIPVLGTFGTNPTYNIQGDAIGVFIGVSPVTDWVVANVK